MKKHTRIDLFDQVRQFAEEEKLIEKGDKVLAGVSGGADSVCLFFVLQELLTLYEGELIVIHVNHGLRGESAKQDESFVRNLCEKEGILFEAVNADVKGKVKAEGISEEEAGRLLRYQIFEEKAKKYRCNKIAVAHNENDNGETVLFHLFRGSGIRGLTGIAVKSGKIIRPLLMCKREEIEQYLKKIGQNYCTDETNLTESYSRNRIRLSVIPYVEQNINSQARKHIVKSAVMLREISEYINKMAEMAFQKIVWEKSGEYYIHVKKLEEEDIVIQKELIRLILMRITGHLRDITSEHIRMILSLLEREVGKKVNLPDYICAIRQYEEIKIQKGGKEKDISYPIVHLEVIDYEKNQIIPKNRCTKWFDYDKIKNTVVIRTRQTGDYIQINEKGQKKTLKSYLIDQKIPEEERDSIPLLADGSHILWVVGRRSSEGYHVTEETKKVLIAKIDGGIEYV